jgi:CBS domain containing-hemolysin-like protein
MIAARDGARAAVRFASVVLAAAAALIAALAPAALSQPASLLRNTVDYPLGLTGATSPAASPLPGHLLAALGSGGHLAALLLLAAAGIAIAASLVVAPPATPAAAARRVAIGLTALFLLAPATRFGYFIYPISLYAWAMLADRQGRSGRRHDDSGQWNIGPVIGRLPAGYSRQVHRVIGHSNGWNGRQMPDAVG